jgi:hypothetical protein
MSKESVKEDRKEERPYRGPQREYVQEFLHAESHIVVRVQQTHGFRPYYSYVIGKYSQHENGESFVPFLPFRADIKKGKVIDVQSYATIIAELILEAHQYVQKRLQDREDEIVKLGLKEPTAAKLSGISRVTR